MGRRLDDSAIFNATVPVAKIQPHPRNYNRHPEEQLAALGESHQEFGQYRSVVVWKRSGDEYILVAGHGYVEAAKREGALTVRADILPEHTSAQTVEAIMLADNLHAQNSAPDEALLAELLASQLDAGYSLSSLGTDEETLDQMLDALSDGNSRKGGRGGDDFDATTDEGPTRTHIGELWAMGRHRLLVGDCTDIRNVERLMDGELSICSFTDPPYGVSYIGKTKDALTIQNDGKEDLDLFLKRAFASLDTALADGAAIYIAHPAGVLALTFGTRFIEQGWRLHQTLIWVKDSMVLGHSDYHYRHEPILYGYKDAPGRRGRGNDGWYGDNTQTSVFEIPRPKRSTEHPTMKPVELVAAMISNSCPPGGIVYDPFAGSGSTMVAAHRLRMRCYMCELDPRYADVVLRRFEEETDDAAVLVEE